jgi:hypothetical protein
LISKTESELAKCWAEWEKVQAKIVALAMEVFGAEAFEGGDANDPRAKQGYRKGMEELELGHQIWQEEMHKEIDLICQDAINNMTATEKVRPRLL